MSKPDIPTGKAGRKKGRTIICCFDGTDNEFGDSNSNVVRFFNTLRKTKPEKQIIYYQPGIGTYTKAQYYTPFATWIHATLDRALAIDLSDHVKDAYQFLMQNYKPGDRISLFGFSRGAYIARALMGMVYKIGILPKDNVQQLDTAFSIYQQTDREGQERGRHFKKTFCFPVVIEFVGVWDTVSSIGVIPRRLPYTSVNYATRFVRHALALDECRARFLPKTWYETTFDRERELDADFPGDEVARTLSTDGLTPNRNSWECAPVCRQFADVREVWFAGCHADVGGGSHHNRVRDSLSRVALRWMIKEVIMADVGIEFDEGELKDIDFDFADLVKKIEEGGVSQEKGEVLKWARRHIKAKGSDLGLAATREQLGALTNKGKRSDGGAKIHDQLLLARSWWFLELIPMKRVVQSQDGNWIHESRPNFGHGRHIPYHRGTVEVHQSVWERICSSEEGSEEMEAPGQGGKKAVLVTPYKPAASNWDALVGANMITYVS